MVLVSYLRHYTTTWIIGLRRRSWIALGHEERGALAALSPRQTDGVKGSTHLADGNFRLDTDPVDLLRHVRVFPQDAIAPDILQGLGIDAGPQGLQVAHQCTGLNHISHSLFHCLTE